MNLRLLLTVSLLAGSAAAQDRVGIPDNGVELGLGWDTEQSRVIHNRCILFAPIQEAGQSIRMELHDVSDSSEVMESLNVSASMSVKTLAGEGSAQASFASSSKASSAKQSLLIRATVDNGVMFVGPSHPLEVARYAHVQPGQEFRDPEINRWATDRRDHLHHAIVLTEEARALLGDGSANEIREFERYCGDSFVSAIYSGAEIIAIASSTRSESSKKSSFRSSMRGEMSAWGAKVEADSQTGKDKAAHKISTQADIQFIQIGGRGGTIPTSAQEFMAKVANLPVEAEQGPRFHSMEVTAYHELPLWPSQVPPKAEDDDSLSTLTNYYWTLQSIEQQIGDLLLGSPCPTQDDNQKEGAPPACTPVVGLKDNEDLGEPLKHLQDEILALRRQLLPVLQEGLELNGEEAERLCCLGLWEVKDEALAARLQAHEQDVASLLQTLRARSLGTLNPNLLRLHLATSSGSRNADDLISAYITRGSQRACTRDPNSPECLSNRQLTALSNCIPVKPNDWNISDTCQRALTLANSDG